MSPSRKCKKFTSLSPLHLPLRPPSPFFMASLLIPSRGPAKTLQILRTEFVNWTPAD